MLLKLIKQLLRQLPLSVMSSSSPDCERLKKSAFDHFNKKRYQQALADYELILEITPGDSETLMQLARLGQITGDYNSALKYIEKLIHISSDNVEAINERGNILQDLKMFQEAVVCHKKAIELNNNYYMAHNSLGSAYMSMGNLDQAMHSFQQAIGIKPDFEKALNNIGLILMATGRFEQAIEQFNLAIDSNPDYAMAHNNIANAYQALNRHEQAIDHLEKAVELVPDNAGIINNLGVAYRHVVEYQKALDSYSRALTLVPNYADVYKNRAIACQDLCRIDEAIENFNKALAIKPDMHDAHSGLLFCLNYKTDIDENYLFQQHVNWATSLQPDSHIEDSDINQHNDSGRRLRIAYLSPDFRNHSVAFFIEPILQHHDKDRIEVYALHDSIIKDAITQRLIAHTEHWLDVALLDDNALARRIRDLDVDMLVDLAGHTANNRMPLLANRLARIQINYLGYCNTTGLDSMDYRITDAQADPENETVQMLCHAR